MTWRVSAVAATALCAALYLPPALLTPFFTKGEPREALVVRTMLDDGDWLLPKRASANGWTIASKPPFFHWLAAATSGLAGATTEWTVRLPSVVLATTAVLCVGAVAHGSFGTFAAWAAMAMLATTFEWVRAASTARVDGTLAALMTLGTLPLYHGLVIGRLGWRAATAAYLLLACAALTKGPVGVVLPGLVVAVFLASRRDLGSLPRLRPTIGVLIVAVVVGGWYVAAAGLGGDAFVQKQILKENVFRFLGATRMKSGHSHPFYYYGPTLFAGLLPWTPFVIAALVAVVRNAGARRDPRLQFPLVWFTVVFVFYSLADAKRSVYLLALYPPAAVLTGWWWDAAVRGVEPARWLDRGATRVVVLVLALVAVVPLLSALAEGVGLDPLSWLAPLLAPKDRANLPVVRAAIGAHLALVVLGSAVLVGALGAAWLALGRRDRRRLLHAQLAFTVALWVLVFTVFQPALARRRTLGPFMRDAALLAGSEPLAFYPRSFDFGAMFYAPSGTGHWRPGREADGVRHLLIWDTELAKLPGDERARLEVLATSEGTDPRGRQHLVLVRRTP